MQPGIYARENFGGILNERPIRSIQLGWLRAATIVLGTFKTNLRKISERPGVSKEIGNALVKQQEKLFELWHRVRDGTLTPK